MSRGAPNLAGVSPRFFSACLGLSAPSPRHFAAVSRLSRRPLVPILPRMIFAYPFRRDISLVAALALLLHALMPLVAPRAAATVSAPAWIEVCSGGQVLLMPAPVLDAESATLDTAPIRTDGTARDDCSLCSKTGAAAMPRETVRVPQASFTGNLPGFIAFDMPDPHFGWAVEHTRSPPSLQ